MCLDGWGIRGIVCGVSMNCRYGNDIEPYLAYMERVCECVKGKRLIFGMDANAVPLVV